MSDFSPAAEATLRIGTPILLAGLGELILEKSGLINIGIEGVMLVGAFAGFAAAYTTGTPWAGVAVGMCCGALLMLLFGLLALKFAADQIVTGMAINLIALGLTGTAYMALGKARMAGGAFEAPAFKPVFMGQTILTWAALALIFVVWWYLEKSERGLELRAVGENPAAAEASGINVLACRWKACLAAGVLGGLGGAFLTISQTASFAPNCTRGRGFVALAAVVLGRYHSIGTGAACLFFGAAFYARDAVNWNAIPSDMLEMLPYLLTLAVLCLKSRASTAPAALGKPYQ